MKNLFLAALVCLLAASSAQAAPRIPGARAVLPTVGSAVRPTARMAMNRLPASKGALPGLGNLGAASPVGLHLAGLNLLGTNGSGLVGGVGVLGGANVGQGLVGAAALSGAGSGRGAIASVGVLNAGQSPVHVGVLGMNLIGK